MFPSYLSEVEKEKTLSDAEVEVKAIEVACNDVVVDTLDFNYDGDVLMVPGMGTPLGFTDTGLDQFGRFLGIRAAFFSKLRNVTRQSVYTDVKVDAHDLQPRVKLRLYGDKIRAVLGPEYTPVSANMVINELRLNGFQDSSLSLRLFADYEATDFLVVSKEAIVETVENDVFHAGMIFRNDDVGRRSTSIQSYLYNSTNNSGIILGNKQQSSFRYNHTKNVAAKVSEGIVYAIGQFVRWFENSGSHIKNLTATRALERERLVPVMKSSAIRDKEVEAIFTIGALCREEYTVWDVINTVSTYAASIEDRERTFALMEYAGCIMSDPKPFAINYEGD